MIQQHHPVTTCVSECGLCSSKSAQPIESTDRHGKPLRVVVCCDCGVIHNDPIPSASELSRFYTSDYRVSYKGTQVPQLRHAARYFPGVAEHIRQFWSYYRHAERILDVGSGSGEFVFLMSALGKEASGLEPTRDYAEFCIRELGIEVTTGEIHTFSPSQKYDHLRLHHVVEHLRDPAGSLRQVAGWLNEGGTLFVEVPDFERYCRVKSPGRIFHFGHIYNFDRASFDHLVAAAGLRVVKRVGPTAAFLEVAKSPQPPTADRTWDVEDKLELYRMHKTGQLREQGRFGKLMKKAVKRWREHQITRAHRTHLNIGRHVARELITTLSNGHQSADRSGPEPSLANPVATGGWDP